MLRSYVGSSPAGPADHVPHFVHADIPETELAKQLRHPRGAPPFGAGRRGDRGKRGLARERHLVGALDVVTGGTNAVVREELCHEFVHESQVIRYVSLQCSCKTPSRKRFTAASRKP